MRCSICATETAELLKGEGFAVCYTCVETGRVEGESSGIVFNRQVACSFCGTETAELFKGPRAAICRGCIAGGKAEAGAGHGARCSFCNQAIGTKKNIFGIFAGKVLEAARMGRDSVICDECLLVQEELAGLARIKFTDRVINALRHFSSR